MDNATIADNFSLLSKLMDIHGANTFLSRTYSIAAFNIEKLPAQLKHTAPEKLSSIRGIGDRVGNEIRELIDSGSLNILSEYIRNTPPGVIEMMMIKGIGPKKINLIWKQMEIESLGELLYACNENRLTRFKGFGEKTQKSIQEAIEFYFLNQGHFLYAALDEIYPQVEGYLKRLFGDENVSITGSYRRQALTIEELEFVVLEKNENIKPKFLTAQPPELLEENEKSLLYKLKNGLRLRLYTGADTMPEILFTTTATPEFLNAFNEAAATFKYPGEGINDTEIFRLAGLPFIVPCLREKSEIVRRASADNLPELIQTEDIKGIIHSHSTWSDGANTLEEMAKECIMKGFEYLVISDHSQSAFYANGLKADRVMEQHLQIELLNKQFAPFKIFKSIESDILNDGSLDYPDHILSLFDLVIASVHSNLKMTEEKAMMRLLNAVENKFTRILGHPTGRLLLSRNGYPVDHRKLIDACAVNQVVIELNAHPRRLDIDWQWIDYAIEKGVLISINPDAHSTDGFRDIQYGVLAGQKAGMGKKNNLSCFPLAEFENWIGLKNN